MRYYIFLVLPLFFSLNLHGQDILTAEILDATTNLPIEGVNVSILGSSEGTTSSVAGRFQLEVGEVNIKLQFSHIAYENYILELKTLPDTLLQVYLTPAVNVLEQIVVNAKNESIPLSDVAQYSLTDFEIVADKIIRLEYHGTFKSRVLTLTNLEGVVETQLELKKIRNIEGLHKSCTNTLYVITSSKAYPIQLVINQIELQQAMRIDSFDRFIRPCKVQIEKDLYYLYEDMNGLRRTIQVYNTTRKFRSTIRSISDEDIIANYQRDLGGIRYGQKVSNIHTNNVGENRRIRRSQAAADFLARVFYKPEFPVYIYPKQGHLLIFNHPEKQIEIFENHQLQHLTPIEYVLDKKWLKKLQYDAVREQVYVLFTGKNTTLLQQLNPVTAKLQIVASLNIYDYQLKKMIIHDGWIYYLKRERLDGQNKQLFKLKIQL